MDTSVTHSLQPTVHPFSPSFDLILCISTWLLEVPYVYLTLDVVEGERTNFYANRKSSLLNLYVDGCTPSLTSFQVTSWPDQCRTDDEIWSLHFVIDSFLDALNVVTDLSRCWIHSTSPWMVRILSCNELVTTSL